MVFLEDVRDELTPLAKARMLARRAFVLPVVAAGAGSTRSEGDAESLATVIFSSGSTGVPKGVMLTHRNVLANVDAIAQVFQLTPRRRDRRRAAVLPFVRLHRHAVAAARSAASASSTTRIRWTRKTIGEIWRRSTTATMLDQHADVLRGATSASARAEQFARLRYAIVGAEKLREPIATAFKEKFGVDLLEGYGCTEMAPVVAVNVPDVDDDGEHQRGIAGRHRSAIRCRASPRRSSIRRPARARSSAGRACCS